MKGVHIPPYTVYMKALSLIAAVLLAGLFFSIFPKEHSLLPERFAATTSTPAFISEENEASAQVPEYEWHRVIRVIDGDTFVAEVNGTSTTIRLIGLDTPEVVDPRKPVQCFGQAASNEAKKLLAQGFVRLEYDASQGALDKYRRVLAYAYLPANSRPEGIMLNRYMIAEGFGHEYTYRFPYKYQEEFKAAERSAREQKKGLWADGVCENA